MAKIQTAVEWLGYELNVKLFYDISPELWEQVNEIFNQAKAMEKEQIIEAYRDGRTDQQTRVPKFYNRSSAIYYNETYGK